MEENYILSYYVDSEDPILEPESIELKILLAGWKLDNLEYVYERCLSSNITIRHLKILQSEDINELIPREHLGDRVIFKDELKKWRLKEHQKASASTLSMNTDINSWLNEQTSLPLSSVNETSAAANVDLKGILKSSISGAVVFKHYAKHNILFSDQQKMLADAIIEHFFKNNLQIKPSDLEIIANEIVRTFPTECKETYFISSGTQTKNPAGKLYNRYNNVRRKLRKIGYVDSKSSSCSTSTTSISPLLLPNSAESNNYIENEVSQDVEGLNKKKCALKHMSLNDTSVESIKETWQETACLREKDIFKSKNSVEHILSQWPLYKNVDLGLDLLRLDFSRLHPGKEFGLIGSWEEDLPFFKTALKENVKDHSCRLLFDLLQKADSQSSQDCLIFLLLHGMIKPNIRISTLEEKSRKRTQWKPTIADSQKSCVLHAKTTNDVQRHVEQQRELYRHAKIHLQPFIIVVGLDFLNIEGIYIDVDGNRFKCDTFLKALDSLYKYYHILNLEYPVFSHGVWAFISNYFFDIEIKTKGATKTSIENFIKCVKKLKQPN